MTMDTYNKTKINKSTSYNVQRKRCNTYFKLEKKWRIIRAC